MIMIPGFIIAWLTFPGVIVHEAAHLLFCRIFGISVFEVCFFRFATAGAMGYVVHEPIKRFWPTFCVGCGPFLINTVLCFVICFSIFLPMRLFNVSNLWYLVMGWLGISIGMHAFPSNQDARIIWQMAKENLKSGNLLSLPVFPIVILVYAGNLLSIIWVDLFYAVGIGFGLPELIMNWVA